MPFHLEIQKHLQVKKDWLKRKWIGLSLKGERLRTPFGVLFGTLEAYGYVQPSLKALELFGMHGLWLTMDYAPHCRTLEFYEIDPVYAAAAKRFLPRAEIICADSIKAVNNQALRSKSYDFIVVDNPMDSPFGEGYFEHFDLFPRLGTFMCSGVLVVNFVYAFQPTPRNAAHTAARVAFYGNANPTLDQARETYARLLANSGRRLHDFIFIRKNTFIGYLALVVR